MDFINVDQKVVITLFNLVITKPLQFHLSENQFVDGLTLYTPQKPINIIPGKRQETIKDDNTAKIPFKPPKTDIYILPWEGKEGQLNNIFSVNQLPNDFDTFDGLGQFAFRAGSSGLGGFQSITTLSTKRRATALLIIIFDQIYPKCIPISTNPYEFDLSDSLLDSIRLISGNEPHQYKGFHFNDNEILDLITKWPLSEMQGDPVKLDNYSIEELRNLFLHIWQIRVKSRKNTSCKIINLALEYYYLSSTITQYKTIFLHLMIAFETLFKAPNERNIELASKRMATILSNTKTEYRDIKNIIYNLNEPIGFCQIRNQIVHGDFTSFRSGIFWKLKNFIRLSIIKIIPLVLSSQINSDDYYGSLIKNLRVLYDRLPN